MEQADPPWHVESQSAWIAPSSKLEILVPVGESARFLYLEFQVLQGTCIDFDVMLEHPDDKSAIRLYGPSRRANSVRTVLPLPQPGVAYATFDNISSWVTSVQLRYSLRLSCEPPAEQNTFARLRTGVVVGRDGTRAAQEAREEEAEEAEARYVLALSKPQEMDVAAGVQEEVVAPRP